MACERDPSARCGTLAASDRKAGARGGPDGHRRRPRHPPAADHLRHPGHHDRRDPPRAAQPSHPLGAARLACSLHRPAGRLRLGGHHRLAVRRPGATGCRCRSSLGRAGRHQGAARPQRRAKTDRTDAHHLRALLRAGTLPQSWMPPPHIADARTQVRLRRALVGERTGWYQRIHAILFHHGLPERSQLLTTDGGPGRPGPSSLRWPARRRAGLRMIDHSRSNWICSTPSWPASRGPSQAAKRSSGAMGSAG